MRIGVYGGTFDPPHVAHLILAAECLDQLGLDQILWVLTPDPPHKQGRAISPLAQRLELLEAALAGNPSFSLSRVDIDGQGRILLPTLCGCCAKKHPMRYYFT